MYGFYSRKRAQHVADRVAKQNFPMPAQWVKELYKSVSKLYRHRLLLFRLMRAICPAICLCDLERESMFYLSIVSSLTICEDVYKVWNLVSGKRYALLAERNDPAARKTWKNGIRFLPVLKMYGV